MALNLYNLSEVYDFWFDKANIKFHFNATIDDDLYIKNKFYLTHKKFIEAIPDFDNIKDCVGYIILYDQITRHIFRNQNDTIKIYLNNILSVVKLFYNQNTDKLNIDEFCFTLLPLRHTNDFENINFVIQETWKRIKRGDDLNKFITATYQRYIKLNDDSVNLQFYKYNDSLDISTITFPKILDPTSVLGEIYKSSHYELFNLNYLNKKDLYIISLSGGVDSMVTSYILKTLGYNIVAVHISYMNRKECSDEIELVKRWCDIMRIELYYRQINEINRKDCMDFSLRDIYESYTKEIRFKTYKNVANIHSHDKTRVLLGHNNDDCFENILTNIASESHYDNLTGMSLFTEIDDITFIRPMLEISKKDIYKFAQDHHIPYLPTSTPVWSQRGKIRDIVKPALKDWNPKMINSMFKLSEQLSSMTRLIDKLISVTYEEVKINKQIKLNLEDLMLEQYYWDKLFKKLGFNISHKSLLNFIDKLVFIRDRNDKVKIGETIKLNLNITTQLKFIKISEKELIINF